MTQDPYGEPPGSGYVVRGEVAPDDEADVTSPTAPMTRFQKVASALRGDRTDPAVTDRASSEPGEEPMGPQSADPNGTWPGTTPAALDAHDVRDETDGDATRPQEVVAAPNPDGALSDFSDLTYRSLLPDTAEFRARWRQVQFRFVDDPQGSVTEAADVIAQVTAELEAAIAERQRAISARQRALRDRWGDGKSADTESLRETLLTYRAFLDQLTGPEAS